MAASWRKVKQGPSEEAVTIVQVMKAWPGEEGKSWKDAVKAKMNLEKKLEKGVSAREELKAMLTVMEKVLGKENLLGSQVVQCVEHLA